MGFCPNCGQPLDPRTHSCPNCGIDAVYDNHGNFAVALRKQLASSLMLVFCILISIPSVLNFINSAVISASEFFVSISFDLLIAVFLWIVYASAKSSKDTMSLGGIKAISVIITIAKIIMWIIIGILIVVAIILFVSPSFLNYLTTDFSFTVDGYDFATSLFDYATFGALIVAIIILICAVLLTLVNIFYVGSISKATKSVISSMQFNENQLRKFGAVKAWLIVIGVFYALAKLTTILSSSDPINILSSIISVSLYFVGAALAGKIGNTKELD